MSIPVQDRHSARQRYGRCEIVQCGTRGRGLELKDADYDDADILPDVHEETAS